MFNYSPLTPGTTGRAPAAAGTPSAGPSPGVQGHPQPFKAILHIKHEEKNSIHFTPPHRHQSAAAGLQSLRPGEEREPRCAGIKYIWICLPLDLDLFVTASQFLFHWIWICLPLHLDFCTKIWICLPLLMDLLDTRFGFVCNTVWIFMSLHLKTFYFFGFVG